MNSKHEKSAGIGINISRPYELEGNRESPLAFEDVEISGNRAGLLALAKLIQEVADSDENGFHRHLWPDDDSLLLRTREYGLTITRNSKK